jgi:hypothetical protein
MAVGAASPEVGVLAVVEEEASADSAEGVSAGVEPAAVGRRFVCSFF